MLEGVLMRGLTVGLVLSLISFALSYVIGLFSDKVLSYIIALFATLTLTFTPLMSVIFIAVEEAKRKDYGGLMIAALVMLVVIVSLMLTLLLNV